jgi:hypothetical protein
MIPKDNFTHCACCSNPNLFARALCMQRVSTKVYQAYTPKMIECKKIQIILDQKCIGVDYIHMSADGTIAIAIKSAFTKGCFDDDAK